MGETELEQWVTIREASKAVHRSRDYVRKLIDRGEVKAIICGGSEKSPRLKIRVADLQEAILRTSIYIPPAVKQRTYQRKSVLPAGRLHPASALM